MQEYYLLKLKLIVLLKYQLIIYYIIVNTEI
jgi:hypothetical protein